MKFFDDAKLKMGVFLRERKERAEEKKALKRMRDLPNGAAPLAWCILLTMVGVAALAGSTWMLLVFIVGSVGHFDWFSSFAAGTEGEQRFLWSFEMDVHWAVAIGLFLFCLAIAIFNAVWIEARKHIPAGGFRNFLTGLGVVVALFMIAGATVVQQRGTDARAQDDAVAIQSAQVNATAAQARLTRAETRLREMRNHENQYMAVAANVGAAEFERSYLSPQQRASETPERLRLLERSLGAARQADALEAEIADLQTQVAMAQTGAAEAAAVTVRAEGLMAGPTAVLEDIRKPVTSILGEILAFSAFSFALAAWRSRRPQRDVERSGWADEGHRIEDLREEEPVVPQPMKPAREVVTDAETGEELVKVKPREYWRKRKGKVQKLDIQPEIPPDETGVTTDGGKRTAVTLGGEMEVESEALPAKPAVADSASSIEPNAVMREGPQQEEEQEAWAEQPKNTNNEIQNDLSEEADEPAVDAMELELAAAVEAGGDGSEAHADTGDDEPPGEPQEIIEHHETSEREEPETDPKKLIAAE